MACVTGTSQETSVLAIFVAVITHGFLDVGLPTSAARGKSDCSVLKFCGTSWSLLKFQAVPLRVTTLRRDRPGIDKETAIDSTLRRIHLVLRRNDRETA